EPSQVRARISSSSAFFSYSTINMGSETARANLSDVGRPSMAAMPARVACKHDLSLPDAFAKRARLAAFIRRRIIERRLSTFNSVLRFEKAPHRAVVEVANEPVLSLKKEVYIHTALPLKRGSKAGFRCSGTSACFDREERMRHRRWRSKPPLSAFSS